jgi:hypothetical protein
MGWQKTFTVSRRSKGCHLVTEEIASQIQEGLQDVQVGVKYPHTSNPRQGSLD